jgi:hypothetical protein
VGNHVYLYECEGYREDGKVKGRRQIIGKIDPETGTYVYKEDYLKRMKAAGTPVPVSDDIKRFSANDIKNSTVTDTDSDFTLIQVPSLIRSALRRTGSVLVSSSIWNQYEFGLTDLLGRLAEKIGLMDALRASNPRHCAGIYALASHLAASGEPFMHVQDWLEKAAVAESVGNLTSQKISEILTDITPGECEKFFQEWAQRRVETEYLALDITSVSSYSELVDDVEWGYNRDGEDLPQVTGPPLQGMV